MISDDALFIYSISSKGVKMIEAVPWSAENFEGNVALIISKECGGKPVLIMNDMVEQHYRKEKIPRVSMLDKQNVVKRKLNVAFPNYPVRAALPLKEKIAKTDKSMAGSVYIFAAVPASEAFKKTMAAATKSLAPIAGFSLLPIEASDMIKKLADKLAPKGEKKAKWTVFIGQHQGGGLRQIVIKNGELALTRMTPIVETDDDAALWANEVNQEFQATMSYLSRFGFDSSDGLNVILIADPSAGDIVSELIDVPCNFHAMPADEVARLLKLSLGSQDAPNLADGLHVAWIGRKSKFILPMKAKQIDNVSQPRQVAMVASVLLLLGGCFQAYQLLDYYQKLTEGQENVGSISQRKAQLDLHYEKEIKRKKDLGFDIQLIQSSLGVQEQFEKKQIPGIQLFYKVGKSLGKDMKIDRIQVTRGKMNLTRRFVDNDAKPPLFMASMQMSFPSTTNAERGNKEVEDLRTRLQQELPDHIVKVSKLLEDYEYSEEIVVESGNGSEKSTAQDYIAELSIEGPPVE
tara:strand:+ start:1760 stop:3313 length:1554 start_codon:yes stop_codon:yes gene_type:complete